MPRLKDVLKESGDVYVKVEMGSSDKFVHKSGNTYIIQLNIEDMSEADDALGAFMTKELKRHAEVSKGLGSSKEKTVYVSAH